MSVIVWLDDVNDRARAIGVSILRMDAKNTAEVVVEVLSAPADDKYGHLAPAGPVFTTKADQARLLGYQLISAADEAELSDYRRLDRAVALLRGVSDETLNGIAQANADRLVAVMQKIDDGEL